MSFLARDPSTGDLLVPFQLITDPVQCAAYAIQNDLNIVVGEWAFNVLAGFPWMLYLGQKNPSLVSLRSRATAAILRQAPVVVGVPTVSTLIDTASRALTLAFIAKTNSGANIVGGGPVTNPPFIAAAVS